MNLTEQAVRLRQVSHDILNVAEGMSNDGTINHADVIRTASVVVESLLRALANTNNFPDGKIQNYRDTFVTLLDRLIQSMEQSYDENRPDPNLHDNWRRSDIKTSAELTVVR